LHPSVRTLLDVRIVPLWILAIVPIALRRSGLLVGDGMLLDGNRWWRIVVRVRSPIPRSPITRAYRYREAKTKRDMPACLAWHRTNE